MRSGSVMALNTRSRGASNSLVMRISLSEGSVTFVAKLLAVAISFLLVLSFELAKHVVELLESLLPRAAVRRQPVVELLQGLRAQAVDALLRQRTDLDEPGFAQDRSEEHTSELQSQFHLVCRLLLEKKKEQTQVLS